MTLGFGCQRRRAQEEEFPFRYVVPSATALHCTGLDIIFEMTRTEYESTVRCGVHMFVFTAAAVTVVVAVAVSKKCVKTSATICVALVDLL